MPGRWWTQLTRLAAWIAAALVFGLWFGQPGWWLAGALALYLANVLRKLYLLDRLLRGRRPVPLFATRGFWPEVFADVEKLRAKARNRKKKYHRVLREVRESTGALRDGGVILNADNEIVWFNPAASRLLGLDMRTDIGQRIDNLIRHPELVRHLAEPGGEGVTIPSPRDSAAWLSVQLIPYGRDQRIAIARDVTREVRLERMRRDFVANASHELRSPLTVIGGYLDTLAEEPNLPADWQAPISEMLRQTERMTRILHDLIELTRLESAEGGARHDVVDFGAILRRIRDEFAARGAPPAVGVHIDTDAALLGDESEIYSIAQNLISNALRFTAPDGGVDAYWRIDGGEAIFDVVDTGIGIPEEQLPRITERFYRVDPGRSRASGGTGLGLAIVKHALQRHEATLEIASVEGEGSRFSCRFPAERVAYRGGSAEAVV